MGYTQGTKWNDETINNAIFEVMKHFEINTMPTQKQMHEYFGNVALQVAISKRGGFMKRAKMLGIEHKGRESDFGERYEFVCKKELEEHGHKVEKMKRRYPYDLLVNGNIKVDVKVAKPTIIHTSKCYSFNLEKANPTCDLYIAYCLNDDSVAKRFIIPATALKGQTQLCVGENSKYDKYNNAWGYLDKYDDFYRNIV